MPRVARACDHGGEHCPAWPARVVLRDLGLAWLPPAAPEPVFADPGREAAFRLYQKYERRRVEFDAAYGTTETTVAGMTQTIPAYAGAAA